MVSEIRLSENLKKKFFLRSRANFQMTIFLVLLDIESCLMVYFDGITELCNFYCILFQ